MNCFSCFRSAVGVVLGICLSIGLSFGDGFLTVSKSQQRKPSHKAAKPGVKQKGKIGATRQVIKKGGKSANTASTKGSTPAGKTPIPPQSKEIKTGLLQGDEAKEKDKGKNLGIAIGVNDNPFPGNFPILNWANADARQFHKVILDPNAPNSLLTTDAPDAAHRPTREVVLAEVKRIAAEARPQDVLWFFFSGHGTMQDKQNFFIVNDSIPGLRATYVSEEDIRVALKKCKARARFLVFDACRSAPKDVGDNNLFQAVLKDAAGTYVLMSCKAGQISQEFPDIKHGAFTYFLLLGLAGASIGENETQITFRALERYVANRVKEKASEPQTPEFLPANAKDIVVSIRKDDLLDELDKLKPEKVEERKPLDPFLVIMSNDEEQYDEVTINRIGELCDQAEIVLLDKTVGEEFIKDRRTLTPEDLKKKYLQPYVLKINVTTQPPIRSDVTIEGERFENYTCSATVTATLENEVRRIFPLGTGSGQGGAATPDIAAEDARTKALRDLLVNSKLMQKVSERIKPIAAKPKKKP